MTKRVKMVRGSDNVFRDLGFPEDEARNLALRSEIMIRIEEFVEQSELTQARAAARLGLTQPRLNALLKGKIDRSASTGKVSSASHYSGTTSSLTNIDTGINTRPNGADKSITPGSSTDQSEKLVSIIVSTVPVAPPRSKRTLSPTLTSTPFGYF